MWAVFSEGPVGIFTSPRQERWGGVGGWQVVRAGLVAWATHSGVRQIPFCFNSFFTHTVGKCPSGALCFQGTYLSSAGLVMGFLRGQGSGYSASGGLSFLTCKMNQGSFLVQKYWGSPHLGAWRMWSCSSVWSPEGIRWPEESRYVCGLLRRPHSLLHTRLQKPLRWMWVRVCDSEWQVWTGHLVKARNNRHF